MLAVLLSAVAGPPASAATRCAMTQDDIGTPRRNCEYHTRVANARLDGFAWWTFDHPRPGDPGHERTGQVTGTIYDLKTDGQCAYAKITLRSKRYPSLDQTVWHEACHPGGERSFTHRLNENYPLPARPAGARKGVRSGTYAVFVCAGRTNCVKVWSHAVNGRAPQG